VLSRTAQASPRTTHKQVVAGLSSNVQIPCTIAAREGLGLSGSDIFWIVNGSVYGLLQVPGDFVVCDEIICDLNTFKIPVIREEMNGSTFQCVHISHLDNIPYLGDITVLDVSSFSSGTELVVLV
jgi:hypothetical protein